jgi:general L-amino acid transport system substrate-binding protein
MVRFFRRLQTVVALAALALWGGFSPAWAATRLEMVKARGFLNCGVSDNAPGFSQVNARGAWSGLEVEFCSALATAIFSDKDAVKFRALPASERFRALQDGEIDILMRANSWTLTRDTDLGARYVEPLFYDGQAFLVPRGHAIASVLELSGASICVLPGSNGERSVSDFFGQRRMRYQLVTSEKWDQLVKTYLGGGCTVLTGDASLLASERSHFAASADHVLLPETISKEPLAPAVKAGDDGWFSIVRWTLMALISAEEFGLNAANADTSRNSTMLDVRRFLGLEGNIGQPLGLARDWAFQIVKQVGNYGEIFERTLGQGSPFKLDRGLNNLWTKGGLMYAAPLR